MNVGGLNQGLSKLIQKISGNSSVTNAIASAAPAAVQTLGKVISGIGHHGHKGAQMMLQIQQAVTTALQSSQASGNTADPDQTIENAIAQVLQATMSSASSTADSDESDPQTPSPLDQNSFFQTLQSFGINEAQFHKDFLSAVQDVANKTGTSAGTILKNTPPGLIINMLG